MWPTKLLERILSPREAVDGKSLAASASALAENTAYQRANEEILRTIVEKWLGSAPDAVEERERLFFQANALRQIQQELRLSLAHQTMKAR